MRINLTTLAVLMFGKAIIAFTIYLTKDNGLWAFMAVSDTVLGVLALCIENYVKGK